MEKNMSKTDDNPKLYRTKLENRVLADSELDAVTGARKGGAIIVYDYEGSALRESTIHPAKVTVPDIKLG
jgi:hypothetical protein